MSYQFTLLGEEKVSYEATHSKKGAFRQLAYLKTAKLTKAHIAEGHVIQIYASYNGRFAIDYDNMAVVIEERENGKPKGELKGLYAEVEDILYRNAQGELMVRFYPNWNGHHEKRYFINGEETTKEALLAMGFSKNELGIKEGGELPRVLSLRASGIVSIK